jgi:hypothetical protein
MRDALESDAAREDEPSVMRLTLELQLARAEAELGDTGSAMARIEQLMEAFRDGDQPVAIGLLHETGARVAALARDRVRRDAHVDLMKRWYTLTRNPSLLMRAQRVVEALAEAEQTHDRAPSAPPDQETVTRVTTQRQMASVDALFDDCKSMEERVARALHIIVEQTAGTIGHLYLWKDKKNRLVATVGGGEADDEIERILQDQLEAAQLDHDQEPTSDARAFADMAVVAIGADASPEEERHATMILSTGGRHGKVVGAVVLRAGREPLRPMRQAVVDAIARNIVSETDRNL